ELNTQGLKSKKIKEMRSSFEAIKKVINIHPGLKLEELLNSKKLNNEEKEKEVIKRTGLFNKFVENNSDLDYLTLNYTHDSRELKSINWKGINKEEQTMVLNSAKAYQRIYSFTQDVAYTGAILKAGFHSAIQITGVTLPEFVLQTGLKEK